jgi:hypothetical protein
MNDRKSHLQPGLRGLLIAVLVGNLALAGAAQSQMRDTPPPDALTATAVATVAFPATSAVDVPEKKSGTMWKGCLAGVVAGLIVPGLGNLIGLVLGCGAGYATS